jgi:hypothetical protein
MPQIFLTKGQVTIVDEADFERLSQRKWCALHIKKSGIFYAASRIDGKFVLMHRYLTDAPKGMLVDHANRNTLDNRRANLRVCTKAQNNANKGAIGKHGLKGVYLQSPTERWGAQITVNGMRRDLGRYDSKAEAARAYDAAAIEAFGEFALTNANLGLV